MLAGAIASSVYLLEHAIWSCKTFGPTKDLDVEVFRRWVTESDLESVIQSVKRARFDSQERIKVNSALVFGLDAAKAKL